jgi:hypothetical protein
MTAQLRQTLCDHAAGNYRIRTTMAAELLAAAAQRELPVLDQKLYMDVFAQPAQPPSRVRMRLPNGMSSSRRSLSMSLASPAMTMHSSGWESKRALASRRSSDSTCGVIWYRQPAAKRIGHDAVGVGIARRHCHPAHQFEPGMATVAEHIGGPVTRCTLKRLLHMPKGAVSNTKRNTGLINRAFSKTKCSTFC